VGFREAETDIAASCRPREYDDGFKAFVGTYIGFAAIDLELVCLNGNLELAGVGISTRQTSFDKLDIRIRVIDPDRGRASSPACLIRKAGWLYSGFVAVTSRTEDAELRAPSFDVIDIVAMVFLREFGVLFENLIRRTSG
jgi:hypothetical protein